jgi:hypothetical protein
MPPHFSALVNCAVIGVFSLLIFIARHSPVTCGCAVIGFNSLLLVLARQGKAKYDPDRTLVFRHPALFRRCSCFIAFVIPIAITVLVVLQPPPPQDEKEVMAVALLFGLLGIIGAVLLWESFHYRLALTPDGLECSPGIERSLVWGHSRFILWNDVKDVSYIPGCFVISAVDGWKFRVFTIVPGLNDFLETCEKHLTPHALDKARPGYAKVRRDFPD